MGAVRQNLTDRAFRYRANQAIPEHPRVCAFCGGTGRVEVGHVDGHEENDSPDNLTWTCRPCNVVVANVMRNAGLGRLTRQYNPTRGGGAANVGEWMAAVGSIRPHVDRGERGLVGTMSVSDAVAMIRATPHAKRSEFARALRRHRNNPAKNPLFGPGGIFGSRDYTYDLKAAREAGQEERRAKPAIKARYRGYKIYRTPDGEFFSSLDPDSWYDTAAQVKRAIDDYKKGRGNPGKFDRCVKEVKARGGAKNAYAVCTAAGTRQNPFAVVGSRRMVNGRYQEFELKRFGTRAAAERAKRLAEASPGKYSSFRIAENPASRRRNPADAAADAFQEFHGHPSTEIVTVKKEIHHHEHLAAAGELRKLVVKGIDHQVHSIKGFKGALLAFNEAKNQLFVEGGDQSLNLADFGIKRPHELETLGKVIDIDYHATKTHLGDEGGTATYTHRFRTTNENGEHVTVQIARYPDLIYRVLDEQFEFSGGSYVIRREGIDR